VSGRHSTHPLTHYELSGNLGTLSKPLSDPPELLSYTFVADESDPGRMRSRVLCGSNQGSIFVWQQLEDAAGLQGDGAQGHSRLWLPRARLLSVVTDVHDGPVAELSYTGPYPPQLAHSPRVGDEAALQLWSERLVSASRDGSVNVWALRRDASERQLPFDHLASAHISAPGSAVGHARRYSSVESSIQYLSPLASPPPHAYCTYAHAYRPFSFSISISSSLSISFSSSPPSHYLQPEFFPQRRHGGCRYHREQRLSLGWHGPLGGCRRLGASA
jgi:WD40 repeat protein